MNNFDFELFKRLSIFLNDKPDIIKEHHVELVSKSGLNNNYIAYLYLLRQFLDYDFDYSKIVKLENPKDYNTNSYYQDIKVSNKKYNNWTLKYAQYKPYELFISNDFRLVDDTILPTLGYFEKPFKYIAVYEADRLWMSITPNEINTMKDDINLANGNLLVAGLGLGYFPYMTSLKENVKSITIVEKDKNVINLFNKVLAKQFKFIEKIKIINDDFINYIKNNKINDFDFIYVDIYHDVSDGLPLYKEILSIIGSNIKDKIHLWIEKTMKFYL